MAEVTLLETIVKAIDDKKGSDIQVLDIHEQTGIADYFVICNNCCTLKIKRDDVSTLFTVKY